MNKDYTHFTIVLDRSGSMGSPASVWTDTIGGLKSTIVEQKKNKDKCTFSLYSFDSIIENNLDFADIQTVSEDVESFGIYPRGMTALYDAIGRAITETGAKLAKLPESERPRASVREELSSSFKQMAKKTLPKNTRLNKFRNLSNNKKINTTGNFNS